MGSPHMHWYMIIILTVDIDVVMSEKIPSPCSEDENQIFFLFHSISAIFFSLELGCLKLTF